jgi:hypothetical protein
MDAGVARSSFPDTIEPKKSNTFVTIFSRGVEHQSKSHLNLSEPSIHVDDRIATKTWKPPALRAPVLIFTIAICWSLIAVLQFLLHTSQQESGVLFAPRISDLPLTRTFLYLYCPTIVAVAFSIYWTWIDLETKRMEPYYQLSKENGALGKDSLLLHYPFDFIPLVPLKAARDRYVTRIHDGVSYISRCANLRSHWPVFWASFAVVLVTWGLVPTQAGIFSVRTVTRATNMTFEVSTYHIPVAQQALNLTLQYAQSTYGIVSLNETLPPYMARNYTLAPFRTAENVKNSDSASQGQGTWTSETTMYFLDLYCEDASHRAGYSSKVYTSNAGCNFTLGPNGNFTMGEDVGDGAENLAVKQYTGVYAGYWNHEGFGQYSLDHYCPESANHTFFATFSESKVRRNGILYVVNVI